MAGFIFAIFHFNQFFFFFFIKKKNSYCIFFSFFFIFLIFSCFIEISLISSDCLFIHHVQQVLTQNFVPWSSLPQVFLRAWRRLSCFVLHIDMWCYCCCYCCCCCCGGGGGGGGGFCSGVYGCCCCSWVRERKLMVL